MFYVWFIKQAIKTFWRSCIVKAQIVHEVVHQDLMTKIWQENGYIRHFNFGPFNFFFLGSQWKWFQSRKSPTVIPILKIKTKKKSQKVPPGALGEDIFSDGLLQNPEVWDVAGSPQILSTFAIIDRLTHHTNIICCSNICLFLHR